jgi:hypothetical protein
MATSGAATVARAIGRVWKGLRLSGKAVAHWPDNGEIEGGQKIGPVTLLERLRTTTNLPCRSEIRH